MFFKYCYWDSSRFKATLVQRIYQWFISTLPCLIIQWGVNFQFFPTLSTYCNSSKLPNLPFCYFIPSPPFLLSTPSTSNNIYGKCDIGFQKTRSKALQQAKRIFLNNINTIRNEQRVWFSKTVSLNCDDDKATSAIETTIERLIYNLKDESQDAIKWLFWPTHFHSLQKSQ